MGRLEPREVSRECFEQHLLGLRHRRTSILLGHLKSPDLGMSIFGKMRHNALADLSDVPETRADARPAVRTAVA